MMPAAADRRGLKSIAALVAGVSCLWIGAAYLVPSAPDSVRQLTYVESWLPLRVWAWVWVAAAVVCLAGAWSRRVRPAAFAAAAGLHALWGFSFMASWLLLGSDRAWVSARGYLVIAALILILAAVKEGSRRWITRSSSH